MGLSKGSICWKCNYNKQTRLHEGTGSCGSRLPAFDGPQQSRPCRPASACCRTSAVQALSVLIVNLASNLAAW